MELTAATAEDVDALASLIVGDVGQATTVAGMRLFRLERYEDMVEFTRLTIDSTGGWQSMVVARGPEPIGMIQMGDALLAMTPEIVGFARRLYGEGFQEVLGPRLGALQRVQSTYPPDSLRVSEIHVSCEARGTGIGTALMDRAMARAVEEKLSFLALQTLTSNPARRSFQAWGFEVVATQTDAAFNELTGASGYHLMVREVES